MIREHPWAGVGPNSYVAIAGASDPLTASGVPVHNVLLLSAAELGIIGALLLWLPFAMAATRRSTPCCGCGPPNWRPGFWSARCRVSS